MLTAVKAFLLGVAEFRLSATTHFDGTAAEAYEHGRDLAHRATGYRHHPNL